MTFSLWKSLPFVLALCAVLPADCQTPRLELSAPARKVVAQLAELSGLADGAWRYHEGDVAHGEDPALDDSGWKSERSSLELENGSYWFRRTITLPAQWKGYDLNGTALMFRFNASSPGTCPEIVYVNGRRIAMGESLEPVTLVDKLVPGEVVHLAVKLLPTLGAKHVKPASYMLQFSAARPNPVDVGVEIETASLLLPKLGEDAETLRSQQKMLESAAAAVDLSALSAGDSARLDASLAKAQGILMPLRDVLRRNSVALIGNSHMDTAWLWPMSETVDNVKRTFTTALQLMPEYPQYKYTQSVALYYEWMQEKYPDMFAEIEKRQKEGRWEVTGGMWVEPDLNMPDGESQVRQLLVGKGYFRSQMGVEVKVGWNPDSFGYNWQLPQIYKRAGIDYFVTTKMRLNDFNPLPLKLFWWQSPDGSRVLTYFPKLYNEPLDPVSVAEGFVASETLVPSEPQLMRLYGVSDHGGGPTRVDLDEIEHWMQPEKVNAAVAFGTSLEFFRETEAKLGDAAKAPVWNYKAMAAGTLAMPETTSGPIQIPVWNDELYLEYHRGVYTSQTKNKRELREGEASLLAAERFASVAWLEGAKYPATPFLEAWKKVLVNEFHDIAAGSSVASVYADSERDYDSVRRVTSEALSQALAEMAAHADTRVSAGVPVFVANPLAWERDGIVEATVQLAAPAQSVKVQDARGKDVVSQVVKADAATGRFTVLLRAEDVPSLGYTVLRASAGESAAKSDLRVSGTTLENALLRVEVDPKTGCLTHLVDKRSGFDSIAAGGCGDELQTFTDKPKKYDAWNIDAEALTTMKPITEVDSVKVVEQGPLRAAVRVTRHWGKSTFVQDVVLYAGTDRVDVRNDFDWQETHVLLKAAFPLAASGPMATYEIPYGTIERPTTRGTSVDAAKFEVPALRWADLGDGAHGLSLLNDSKYGYDAAGNVLRLSLLRSPVYPDPKCDRGRQQFTFALYPHAGTWKQAQTMQRGYEFNTALTAMQVSPHEGVNGSSHSFLHEDGDGVIVTTLKKAEAGDDLILRLYEWKGAATTVKLSLPGKPVSVREVNLMEDAVDAPALALHDGAVSLAVGAYQIRTIRIHYSGAGQ